MDDPTRAVLGSQPPDEPPGAAPSGDSGPTTLPPGRNEPSHNPKFIGDAMRSLYRSSATSIERGDATRVIGRTEADSTVPARPAAPPVKQPTTSNNVPAGPRVDVMLWLVLALGLFAIAGVMLSGAL